jgi:hypothetical protein
MREGPVVHRAFSFVARSSAADGHLTHAIMIVHFESRLSVHAASHAIWLVAVEQLIAAVLGACVLIYVYRLMKSR